MRQAGQHSGALLVAPVSGLVALHASALGAGGKFLVSRVTDGMVAVTNYAAGEASSLKGGSMAALLEHLILENMAFGADLLNGIHAWRRCPMVPMTGGASRRAKVSADGQRVVVHAAAIFRKLIGRNRIALHVRRVGVTPGASLRDVERVNSRPGVAG